jgi:hypothetical protein
MHIHKRNWTYPQQGIDALFYIKNHSDDDPDFQIQCQEMINLLFEKFPGLMPLPDRSLAEQGDNLTEQISSVIRSL